MGESGCGGWTWVRVLGGIMGGQVGFPSLSDAPKKDDGKQDCWWGPSPKLKFLKKLPGQNDTQRKKAFYSV